MKRLALVFAALGTALVSLIYSPITISVDIDTSGEDSEGSVGSNGGGEAQAATRTGTDGNDRFRGTVFRDYLEGGGGNDTLIGGGGKDVIQGDEPYFGKSGDDTIYGNFGGDNISGGEGVDKLYGGHGDDVITAQDVTGAAPNGEADIIDCGGGHGDFAFVDPSDQTKNCGLLAACGLH
ncbi:MAG: calcium-binding protein [Rubrobacteraceae bacterium]